MPDAEPPADADRTVVLLWRMAYAIREAHQPQADGLCVDCGQTSPCEAARIADEAWRLARKEYAKRRLRAEEPPNRGRWNR